jgi:hypothetical protein
MLYICLDISRFSEFCEMFGATLDLSRIPSDKLADEADAIVNHHTDCKVFLGHLEPGWMLDPTHQTRLRKLFRKFSVAIVTHFPESLPYSWKTETDVIYSSITIADTNGNSDSLNDGGVVQHQSEV